MKDDDFYTRMNNSSKDFILGVQPALERQMAVNIHPIEDIESTKLIKMLDQKGIDAFYYDKDGDMRALASRVNYSKFSSTRPAFTFRYKLWNKQSNDWDDNREYALKLKAANSTDEFIMFPKLHVESFSREIGSGRIGWSFAANTKDILNYIRDNIDNPEVVRIFTPKVRERRQVISISVEAYAKNNTVMEINCL